jgi:hypothetical protein
MIVYALIDPRTGEVRYIGKTHRKPAWRLQRHMAPYELLGNSHKEHWIRSLLKEGLKPTIHILEKCETRDQLALAEIRHIAQHRSIGAKLTNILHGGDGIGYAATDQSRLNISRALTGKTKTPEHRKKLSLAKLGVPASEAHKAAIRIARSKPRKPLSDQHRINLSRSRGCRPFADQHGNRYETQHSAAKTLNINLGHLNQVLHGKRGHVSGYVFKFIEDDLLVRQFPPALRPAA